MGTDAFRGSYAAPREAFRKILKEALLKGLELAEGEMEQLLKDHAQSVRLVDKTPKYEYSRKPRDANNAGKFTEEDGARWSMPWELAEKLTRVAQYRLATLKKTVVGGEEIV